MRDNNMHLEEADAEMARVPDSEQKEASRPPLRQNSMPHIALGGWNRIHLLLFHS